MDIRTLTPAIWEELRSREARDTRNAPAEVLELGTVWEPFACIFVSQDGSLQLLVSSEVRESVPAELDGLRGLSVQTLNDHLVIGRERQSYLSLSCRSAVFSGPFTRVVQDTLDLVYGDGLTASSAVSKVAATWKEFWASPPGPPLSPSQQRGLIGELSVLGLLLNQSIEAVGAWAGPAQDRHDFRFNGLAIEVKTALGLPRRHQITSLNQLSPDEGLPLFLASIVLDQTAGGTISLSTCVSGLLSRLQGQPLREFKEKLAATGYSPVHDKEYGELTYRLNDLTTFEVAGEFPRVEHVSFSQPLSPRVEAVSYAVNLEGLVGSSLEEVMRIFNPLQE